jgi:hypothetical protein
MGLLSPSDALIVTLLIALPATLILALPFLIWRRSRRIATMFLVICWTLQLIALFSYSGTISKTNTDEMAGFAIVIFLFTIMPGAWILLVFRRTRRAGLILVGMGIIGALGFFAGYMTQIICGIGYILFLIALWPVWRMARVVPKEKITARLVPNRGVLRARSWPDGLNQKGITLLGALIGTMCIVIAFSIATQVIGTALTATRRSEHRAQAADILESLREQSIAGQQVGNLQLRATQTLPKGQLLITHSKQSVGLMRTTAVVNWQEISGRPGQMTLEWLSVEQTR